MGDVLNKLYYMNLRKLIVILTISYVIMPSIIYWTLIIFGIRPDMTWVFYIAFISVMTNLEILTLAQITAKGVENIRKKVALYEEVIAQHWAELPDKLKEEMERTLGSPINDLLHPEKAYEND